MKKILFAALLVPSVAFAGGSSSLDGFYGRVDAGAGIPTISSGDNTKKKNTIAPVVSVGGGYQFNEYFRTDLNLQYRHTPIKGKEGGGITTNSYAAVVNGSVDIPNSTMFTPYLTGGLGYSRLKPKDLTADGKTFKGKDTNNLAWNLGAGVKTKLQDNIHLDVGYKFVNIGKIEFKDRPGSGNLRSHELTAGVIVSL